MYHEPFAPRTDAWRPSGVTLIRAVAVASVIPSAL